MHLVIIMDFKGEVSGRFENLLASSIAFEADSLSCENDLMWSRCLSWWEAQKNNKRYRDYCHEGL